MQNKREQLSVRQAKLHAEVWSVVIQRASGSGVVIFTLSAFSYL